MSFLPFLLLGNCASLRFAQVAVHVAASGAL